MNFTVLATGETALQIGTKQDPIKFGWPWIPLEWYSSLLDPNFNEMPFKEGNGDVLVRSRLIGDINGDGKVDMKDVSYVARRFMCLPSDPLWDPVADINGDNKIDMKDVSTVARHFGEHHP